MVFARRFILLFWTLLTIIGCEFWQTEQQRWTLAPEGAPSMALSRDGRFALFYSVEQDIVLYDLGSNQALARFGAQDPRGSAVVTATIADNPRYALTATQDNFAVWDLAWGQAEGLWSISDGVIIDADIASNGEQVLLGLTNGKAIYVNLGTGRRLEFLAHQEKVNSVAIAPNGRYALSGGNDKNAYFWDTNTGQALYHFPHRARVRQVALQRDGNYAFTADSEGNGFIWDLSNGEKVTELSISVRQQNFSSARFSDDGQFLVTGTPGRYVEVWRTADGKKIHRWQSAALENARPPSAVVYDVALDSQNRVISATSAGIVQAWQAEMK
ncbi:WD40 repeat domain-containing protein [Thaumasiovibrio subtropicus]|uniref:WD40 repeat domain-containing protein n=1 Tax=Thaumasiovibrio subtropicus TaxID=1891207 RepID=UPI000B350495|nr:hypothetical protein [Thaumasiovibrio subtropicus]